MSAKIKLAIGVVAGLWIAYFLRVVSSQYLWILFYQ